MKNKFELLIQDAESIVQSTAWTHEQATMNLAALPGKYAEVYPVSDESANAISILPGEYGRYHTSRQQVQCWKKKYDGTVVSEFNLKDVA